MGKSFRILTSKFWGTSLARAAVQVESMVLPVELEVAENMEVEVVLLEE